MEGFLRISDWRCMSLIVGGLAILLATTQTVEAAPLPIQQDVVMLAARNTSPADARESDRKTPGNANSGPAISPANAGAASAQMAQNTGAAGAAGSSSAAPQQQSAPAKPVGTAAAPAAGTEGIAGSRLTGAVIAPAKQRRVRKFVIRVAIVLGACVAVGTVVALSRSNPSQPRGAQ